MRKVIWVVIVLVILIVGVLIFYSLATWPGRTFPFDYPSISCDTLEISPEIEFECKMGEAPVQDVLYISVPEEITSIKITDETNNKILNEDEYKITLDVKSGNIYSYFLQVPLLSVTGYHSPEDTGKTITYYTRV